MSSAPIIPAGLLAAYNHLCLPAGAVRVDDWQTTDPPSRLIFTADQCIDGHDACVWGEALQLASGSIVQPQTRVRISWENGLSPEQARLLAQEWIATADLVAGWGARRDNAG